MEFRCICLCEGAEELALRDGAKRFAAGAGRRVEMECFRDCSDLLYRLQDGSGCDAVVVAVPGALGMEAAMGVRGFDSKIPLVWCSNDGGFAVLSYRLRCAMFLMFPLEAEQVDEAFCRCAGY